MKASAKDIDTLARTIYGEARNQRQMGKEAVAWVVLNRLSKKSWYGDSIAGVCLKPWQFSCWNESDPNSKMIAAVTLDNQGFQDCYLAALSVIRGLSGLKNFPATHYHTKAISPRWSQGKEPMGIIQDHVFYDDID
jgi:N-acetylmuramoyl-L-alanine amidase